MTEGEVAAGIRETYAARSSAGLKRNLYDSYVRAFRWASDRVKDRGIVCFVSNGSFIDAASFDGFRKTVAEEFSSIYCLNLRGNQRTSGETSRREGGKVFGQGSRTPVAITLMVKNPHAKGPRRILYHDIGDYLSREEKLSAVRAFGDIRNVPWQELHPGPAGDWIGQRSVEFEGFQALGSKKVDADESVFETYSLGVVTNRDAWTYNFSRAALLSSVEKTVEFYNTQVAEYEEWAQRDGAGTVDDFLGGAGRLDPKRISWTYNLKADLRKGKRLATDEHKIVQSMYRPFCKQWLYFDRRLNERVYQLPKLFPSPQHSNLVITTVGTGAARRFSTLVVDAIPNLHLLEVGQCFPLYYFTEGTPQAGLFEGGSKAEDRYVRHDAITDATLARYASRFGTEVSKEDIFFYVYGLLHSPEYATTFKSDLAKMIPRIPMAAAFWDFANAGRELAKLHLNYEDIEPYPVEGLSADGLREGQLRVVKMAFDKVAGATDRSSIVYNSQVKLSGIPSQAYEYEVNGRSAIEWIMDRYQIRTDKDSGILNDPNSWSDDPRYILDLVARIVRVACDTQDMVSALPSIEER